MAAKVAIIMGSDSDWKIMKGAGEALQDFGVKFKVKVVSAHRTPEEMQNFALEASQNGFKVIIAGAGGAAHLPGMVASYLRRHRETTVNKPPVKSIVRSGC